MKVIDLAGKEEIRRQRLRKAKKCVRSASEEATMTIAAEIAVKRLRAQLGTISNHKCTIW